MTYIIWIIVSLIVLIAGVSIGYTAAKNKYQQPPIGSLLIIEDPVDGTQMVLEIPNRDALERVKRRSLISLTVIKRNTK